MNTPRRTSRWRVGPVTLAAAIAVAALTPPAHQVWAQQPEVAKKAPPPASTDPKIPFEKYTLDNGLEVILVQDQSVPLVAVSVWYHVGSGLETPGKSGFAHLFEHMLFQGSKHVGEDRHFDILKQIGSSTVNGTTNADRTNYFEVVPSNQLETALWLESDRMGYLLPVLTKESLANQIDVVRNERRQRYDNVPYGQTRLWMAEMMYPEGHPYRYLTIGRHEDLEAATLDDVVGFYKTWYVPANATLTIAGDFDVATAKELVQRWFGGFPRSTKPSVVQVPMPTIQKARKEMKDDFAKLRQVQWAWHTPAMFAPGDAEFDLLGSVLGGGEASRLYKRLVVEEQLAQSVSAYQGSQGFSSAFVVTVQLRSDADQARAEAIVAEEIAKLRTEPMTDRELKRAITRYEAGAVWGLESLLARAERLQAYNHYLANPDGITFDLDRYRNTTAAAIRDYAKKFLDPERGIVLVTLPGGGQ